MIELNCSCGVVLCCHLLEHLLTVGHSNPQLLVLLQHYSSLFLQGLLLLHLQHTQEVRWNIGN